MMFVIGVAAKVLPHTVPFERSCPNCGNNPLTLHFIHRWLHFFGAPTLPVEKLSYAHCPSCDTRFEEKGMNDEDRALIRKMKKSVPTPWYTFIGWGFIPLFFLIGFVVNWVQDLETRALLAGPVKNDVYILKRPDIHPFYYYVLMRVEGIDGDTLKFSMGNIGFSNEAGAVQAAEKPIEGFEYSKNYRLIITYNDMRVSFNKKNTLERIVRND